MKLEELASQCGEWLRGSGPESDIVISSRIRLARNLAQFPFVRRCGEQDRAAIEKNVAERLSSVRAWQQLAYVDVAKLSSVDRQFLVERQLISRELSEGTGPRGVAIDPCEKDSRPPLVPRRIGRCIGEHNALAVGRDRRLGCTAVDR